MKKILFLIAVIAVVSCGAPKTVTTTTTTTTTSTQNFDASKYESGLLDYGYANVNRVSHFSKYLDDFLLLYNIYKLYTFAENNRTYSDDCSTHRDGNRIIS